MTASYLIAFLLFALPLVVLPFGVSYFETPKVILAEIIIEILFIFFLLKQKLSFSLLGNPQSKLILFMAGLGLIGLAANPQNLFGNIFRMQGIFLFWHLLIFSLISGKIKLPKNMLLVPFFVLGVLLASVYILGGDLNGRAFGTLGEPNALASTAVFLLSFALFQQSKIFRFGGFLLAAWIIFAAGSFSGLLALIIMTAFVLLTKYLKLSQTKSTLACITLIGLSLVLPFIVGGGWFENRSEIWQTALYSGLTSPVLGHGMGNITVPLKQASIQLNNNVQYQFVDSSHNFLLDWWIQGGIIGLISILTLLFLSFRNLIKHKKILETTAFLGLITAMLFNPVSVVSLIAFWWLIGQGFSD